MHLRDYLKQNKIRVADFAEIVKLNRNTIYRILNGDLSPSLELAILMSKSTDGNVTVDEILSLKNVKICPTCLRKMPQKKRMPKGKRYRKK